MKAAYYNENDPKKAAVLRELIKAGLIAPGEVDERSIEDVRPDELTGFTQCHFFAGAGIWSYALRLAGWPDDRPAWTGSCPCPSFSAAGKGEGFEDARHLWPAWYRLVSKCRPATIFGEQVEAAIGYGWIDLVQTDLEAQAYAFGKIVLGACSVGAPHIRLRVYFVADSQHAQLNSTGRVTTVEDCDQPGERLPIGDSSARVSSESAGRRRASRRTSKALLGEEPCGTPKRPGDALSGSESLHSERRTLNEHGDDGRDGHDSGRSEADGIAGARGEVQHGLNSDCSRPLTRQQAGASVGYESTVEPAGSASDGSNSDGGDASTEGLQRGGQHGLRAEDGCSDGTAGIGECPETLNGGNSEVNGRERQSLRAYGESAERVAEAGEFSNLCYPESGLEGQFGDVREWRGPGWLDPITARSVAEAGATRGFWADCDWWYGRDGKYRPIGAGLFPLAHGVAARVVRLRCYGDGIVPQVAKGFIEAYMSVALEAT